jgi:hypothetical protein
MMIANQQDGVPPAVVAPGRAPLRLPVAVVIGLFVGVFIAMVLVVYWRLPVHGAWDSGHFTIGVDFKGFYRPAALALARGEDPFRYSFFNPPWALIPLIPLAFLPEALGAAVMFTTGFFVYGLVAYNMKLRWWAILFFLFNPLTMRCFVNGNIDWMVGLGFILPPQIGLFFLLIKPQLSLGVVVFWLVESWRRGGWREVVRVFAPVSLVLLVSFAIWGLWPFRQAQGLIDISHNASLFPTVLPIGAVLLFNALRSRNQNLAIISSVFLTPYLTLHGYAVALLGLGSAALVIASLMAWVVTFLM